MNWHLLPLSEITQLLQTTPNGIDEITISERMCEHGKNEIENDLQIVKLFVEKSNQVNENGESMMTMMLMIMLIVIIAIILHLIVSSAAASEEEDPVVVYTITSRKINSDPVLSKFRSLGL